MKYSLIHNARLIDVVSGCILKDAAVLIKDDRIHQVGPRQSITLPDDEIKMVDARDGFLLPGFIDCHVHLVLEDLTIPKLISTPLSLTLFKVDRSHAAHPGSRGDERPRWRRSRSGSETGRRERAGARSPDPNQHHDSYNDRRAPGLCHAVRKRVNLFPAISGAAGREVRRSGRSQKESAGGLRAGAEIIKVCTTGGTMSPHDHPTHAQFSVEELRVMVQEADYHGGRKVMAHAQGSRGIKNALRAGVHSIEHGMYLDDEAVELMLERKAFLIPTLLAPVYTLDHCAEMHDLPEWGIRKMKETLEINLESISKAHKAGVRIAMGTDACVSPHGTNLQELGLLCRIGMTPLEAIRSATVVAAECLGWQDQVGTIEAGKFADHGSRS